MCQVVSSVSPVASLTLEQGGIMNWTILSLTPLAMLIVLIWRAVQKSRSGIYRKSQDMVKNEAADITPYAKLADQRVKERAAEGKE